MYPNLPGYTNKRGGRENRDKDSSLPHHENQPTNWGNRTANVGGKIKNSRKRSSIDVINRKGGVFARPHYRKIKKQQKKKFKTADAPAITGGEQKGNARSRGGGTVSTYPSQLPGLKRKRKRNTSRVKILYKQKPKWCNVTNQQAVRKRKDVQELKRKKTSDGGEKDESATGSS